MRADNFQKYVALLANTPQYAPNEPEIQVATLTTLLNNMETANDTIGTIIAPLANARIDRNKNLYDEVSSVWVVLKACKDYISGKYQATSPQAKYVNSLKYRRDKP
jgi:hypothetical protein